ncbi:hypothetical protein MAH1_18960 [Sessilibacter sp. MAH1]
MNPFSSINVSTANALIEQENVVILDLRDRLSYRCGHITNALNFGKENLKMFLQNMNKHLSVLLYCDDGSESEAMADLFMDFGFQKVFSLIGGYEEWVKSHQVKMPKHVCDWLNDHGYSCNDLNRKGFNGETALMYAARNAKTEYVIELIDRGADLDATNNDGNTAVWLACYGNDEHTLQTLIDAGANLDTQNDNGATALIYAASAGREAMVFTLLKAGANPKLATLDEFTALDVASTPKILKWLKHVNKGLSIDSAQQTLSLAV